MFKLVNFVVSLIYLLSHLLHAATIFLLVHLQVLDVLLCLLQVSLLRLDQLIGVAVLSLTLLDLVLLRQDLRGYALENVR